MKHIIYLFILLNLCLGPFAVADQNKPKPDQLLNTHLKSKIEAILKQHKVNPDHLGIAIDHHENSIYQINSGKLFIPASISKLLTTYSVLKKFNLTEKFKTELHFDGKNLYLKGLGDPSFVSENMWYLVNEFHRRNIHLIPGDIIVDDYYFDDVRFDESRESVRVDRSYDSPVGAMSFNWNSINIFIQPAKKSGDPAQVVLDPESNYFQLINRTVTQSQRITKDIVIDVNQKNRKITVSGQVLISAAEKAYYKNVADPATWSGENLKAFLLQRGIKTAGQIKRGRVPVSAEKIVTYESKNLSSILADMNKFSNNYVAEMLTKNLAAASGLVPARLDQGIKIIQKDLQSLGLNEKDFIFYNPSGFTRDNKLSARAMNKVLKVIQDDFRYFPTMLESLPISAVDGTLRRRMKNSHAEGFIRAKTGYLDQVVTLAGYAGLKNGEIYHFSFLYNGPLNEAQVREAFDQVLISLLE